MKLYRYQPIYDKHTIIDANLPENAIIHLSNDQLEEFDNYQYVAFEEKAPEQPKGIILEEVVLTAELKEKLRKYSSHWKRYKERIIDKIREKYSIDEELNIIHTKNLATKTTEDKTKITEYDEYVKSIKDYYANYKASLGI
jgi:hypothetical protein